MASFLCKKSKRCFDGVNFLFLQHVEGVSPDSHLPEATWCQVKQMLRTINFENEHKEVTRQKQSALFIFSSGPVWKLKTTFGKNYLLAPRNDENFWTNFCSDLVCELKFNVFACRLFSLFHSSNCQNKPRKLKKYKFCHWPWNNFPAFESFPADVRKFLGWYQLLKFLRFLFRMITFTNHKCQWSVWE